MKKSRETTKYTASTWACLVLLLSAVTAYLYFLNMSVVQVVIRTESVQTQRMLEVEIARLEAEYITAQHKVSARMASLDGYSADTRKVFVSRPDETRIVFNDN